MVVDNAITKSQMLSPKYTPIREQGMIHQTSATRIEKMP